MPNNLNLLKVGKFQLTATLPSGVLNTTISALKNAAKLINQTRGSFDFVTHHPFIRHPSIQVWTDQLVQCEW
jgi:hypothetical protein